MFQANYPRAYFPRPASHLATEFHDGDMIVRYEGDDAATMTMDGALSLLDWKDGLPENRTLCRETSRLSVGIGLRYAVLVWVNDVLVRGVEERRTGAYVSGGEKKAAVVLTEYANGVTVGRIDGWANHGKWSRRGEPAVIVTRNGEENRYWYDRGRRVGHVRTNETRELALLDDPLLSIGFTTMSVYKK